MKSVTKNKTSEPAKSSSLHENNVLFAESHKFGVTLLWGLTES